MSADVHSPPHLLDLPPQFSIRQVANKSELDFFFQQASILQWNPCPLDLSNVFFDIDKKGFFVCVRSTTMAKGGGGEEGKEEEEEEEVIGCVSAVRHSADYAFLGYFIVLEEYQRRGIGTALFRTALQHAGRERCIGLDGVVEQQSNYSRSGFAPCYDVLRFVGHGITATNRTATNRTATNRTAPSLGDSCCCNRIVCISEVDFAEVVALDRKIHACERGPLLARLFAMPGVCVKACIDDTGSVLAYGALRPGADRPRIGPLVSPTRAMAHALLEDLLLAGSVGPGDEYSMDVPAASLEGVALAQTLSTTGGSSYQCARMYRPASPSPSPSPSPSSTASAASTAPQVDLSFCFAQLSMEVG